MVYGLSSQFVLRMTGFPVDILRSLLRPQLASRCDELLAGAAAAEAATERLLAALRERGRETRALRKAIERREPIELPANDPAAHLLPGYDDLHAVLRGQAELDALYASELEAARLELYRVVDDERFRTVLLFSSPGLEKLMLPPGNPPPRRDRQWRRREVTWLSYLQRLTTKNETISFYGPLTWGQVDARVPTAAAIELDDREIDGRDLYFERWACDALAALMSQDPEVFPYLQPAWRADVSGSDRGVKILSKDRDLELDAAELTALRRCDGQRRVHEIADDAALRRLAEREVIWLSLRIPLTDAPFAYLQDVVASWPAGPAKARWAGRLEQLEGRRQALVAATGDLARQQVALGALRDAFAELGIGARNSQALYAARLPVNEECRRAARRVLLGRPFIEQATVDVAPWYELWRDLAGLYMTRVYEKLAAVFGTLGGGPVPLPTFLRACTAARVMFAEKAGIGLVPELDDEIQAVWQEQLGARAREPELELTADDLSVFRRRFRFRRMRGFDRPAPDFQIAARDEAALREGRFTVLLAEIHHDGVLWQRGALLWCPDVARLLAEYRAPGSGHGPIFGDFPPDTIHTMLMAHAHVQDWIPSSDAPVAGLPAVRPADVMVELTPEDLVLRHGGRVVGSLVHTWAVFHNTHRTQLGATAQRSDREASTYAPRLRVGRVVVQRRRWLVRPDDQLRAELERSPAAGFLALRRLRRVHDLPEEVFVLPVLPVRQSSHKNAKPTFVDFRNPLLVERLASQVSDYRQLVVTEMLPTTDDCWLADHRGRYSCEFRMTAQPAERVEDLDAGGFVHAQGGDR